MKFCKLSAILIFAAASSVAQAARYTVAIQCPKSVPGNHNIESISANSDLEAFNEANRILQSNTSYIGQGCNIVYIRKD